MDRKLGPQLSAVYQSLEPHFSHPKNGANEASHCRAPQDATSSTQRLAHSRGPLLTLLSCCCCRRHGGVKNQAAIPSQETSNLGML